MAIAAGRHGLRDRIIRQPRPSPEARRHGARSVGPADPRLAGVDGIAFLADGAVYVNTFFAGQLFRIPVNADGSAGAIVHRSRRSMPLSRPDGLRTVGPRTLIQAEGQGRVTELTINGNRAEVRVLQDGLTGRHRRDPRRRHCPRPRRTRQGRRRAVSPAVTRKRSRGRASDGSLASRVAGGRQRHGPIRGDDHPDGFRR